MKAVVQNGYGGSEALKIKEVEKPKIKKNGILVRVMAASVNAGDLFTVKGSPWLIRFSAGFPKPKDFIPGWDVAGLVEDVGTDASLFKPGDEVFGSTSHAFAEFVSDDQCNFAKKPTNLTFDQTSAIPTAATTAATTALLALRDQGKVQPGHDVLINGATGGVGTFSVQIAKILGARVTGVCSTAKMDMVLSLGADRVVDYTREDFTKMEDRFDLILDNAASRAFSDLKKVLKPKGLILPNSGHGGCNH